MRHLSQEIVSLIHHVELNESGWWRKAVGQVIQGVLWKSDTPQSLLGIKEGLKRELDVQLFDDVLTKQLDILSSQGHVIRVNSTYKLTEHCREVLTELHEKSVKEQEGCHASFLESCALYCPELPPGEVWDKFTNALSKVVQVAGANLYHLLADGNLEKEDDWVFNFLRPFPQQSQDGLRRTITDFFAPSNHLCRRQVLRYLTAHFFAEASQLAPTTLAAIEGAHKKRSIKVVLDTNFIFSVLQLHANPADEAALSLVDIAQRKSKHLDLRLYVLPGTLEEAKRTLLAHMQLVERVRTTNAIARVAVTQPLPSIAKKFFEAAQQSPGLTARAFFQPYIDDLRTILIGKSIHVLDAHPAIYNQRQDVIDDILDEQSREESEVPANKRKGYETLLHDVVLWHAVKDRRGDDTDSPFEVEFWAVSIDWRLIAFDRKKRSANASKLPVVLHPSNLVQLIQFWVPRTEGLEDSLVNSLKLPFFFRTFDPEDERATVKVLEAISRFENVGDLPEPTLKVVLANQVLRARLRDGDASNDEVFTLVRDELLAEHRQTIDTLGATKDSLIQSELSLAKEKRVRENSEQLLDEKNSQLEKAKELTANAERKAQAAENQRTETEKALKKLIGEKDREVVTAEIALAKTYFILFFIVAPILFGCVLGYIGFTNIPKYLIFQKHPFSIWPALGAVTLLPLGLIWIGTDAFVKSHPQLTKWWLTNFASVVGKKAVAAPGVLAAVAIFQGGIWDSVKAMLGLS